MGTAWSKAVILDDRGGIEECFEIPTEWNGRRASDRIWGQLERRGIVSSMRCAATGCGKATADFADLGLPEGECLAKGAMVLFGEGPVNLIDVGWRHTSVISAVSGTVEEHFLNHGCAAGTGRFVEMMADRLGCTVLMLDEAAGNMTESLNINFNCPVSAESDLAVCSILGISKENLAGAVMDYTVGKIKEEYYRLREWRTRPIFFTGGLCCCSHLLQMLSAKLPSEVKTCSMAGYAAAAGAARAAMEMSGEDGKEGL